MYSKKNYKLILGNNYKWDINPTIWTSVFLGTNDHIINFKEITTQLNAYKKEEMEFISIIGGMKFLEILEEIQFNRVTFFDKNINEISKLMLVIDYLNKIEFNEYDYFRSINKYIIKNPERFYLPKALANFEIETTSDFYFEYKNKKSPLFSLLDPENYPEFRWNPKEAGFNQVKKTLKNCLNKNFYLDIPSIDVDGKIAVIFLTHSGIKQEEIAKKIKNASMILPIYAIPIHDKELCSNKTDIFYNLKNMIKNRKNYFNKYLTSNQFSTEKNKKILNPHLHWYYIVSRYIKGKSLHIWSESDKNLIGSVYDEAFDKGIAALEFIDTEFVEIYDTIIFHLIFGKTKKYNVEQNIKLFKKLLQKSSAHNSRIIVTDHNKKNFEEYDFLIYPDEIQKIIEKSIGERYDISVKRYIPGDGLKDRNVIFVLDPIKNKELEY